MRYLGVDGCSGGWCCVVISDGQDPAFSVAPSVGELWSKEFASDLILVDIPIGLRTEEEAERLCDTQARRMLGAGRSSSVFPAPSRRALAFDSYEDASEANRQTTGRGLSKQSFAICSKIRQVDNFLTSNPEARDKFAEVHPELLFWALNGKKGMHYKKSTSEGRAERTRVLSRYLPNIFDYIEDWESVFPKKIVKPDDILDATAAAISGYLAAGKLSRIPSIPEIDDCGLPMQMCFYETATGGKE